jgi:hypothetical protein
MNKSVILHIHSFVDVITNSSSEVFVSASEKTIGVVKSIIQVFLNQAKITESVDELFDVKLVYRDYRDDEEVDIEGESEYKPSRVVITLKATQPSTDLVALTEALKKLNGSFSAIEYMN